MSRKYDPEFNSALSAEEFPANAPEFPETVTPPAAPEHSGEYDEFNEEHSGDGPSRFANRRAKMKARFLRPAVATIAVLGVAAAAFNYDPLNLNSLFADVQDVSTDPYEEEPTGEHDSRSPYSVELLAAERTFDELSPAGPMKDQGTGAYFHNGQQITAPFILNNSLYANPLADGSATYDVDTNTLTLTNFNHPDWFFYSNQMGNDFKICVYGECEIGSMRVWGWNYGGSLTITGTGILRINPEMTDNFGLWILSEDTADDVGKPAGLSKSRLRIDRRVTVEISGEFMALLVQDTTDSVGIEAPWSIVDGGDWSDGTPEVYFAPAGSEVVQRLKRYYFGWDVEEVPYGLSLEEYYLFQEKNFYTMCCIYVDEYSGRDESEAYTELTNFVRFTPAGVDTVPDMVRMPNGRVSFFNAVQDLDDYILLPLYPYEVAEAMGYEYDPDNAYITDRHYLMLGDDVLVRGKFCESDIPALTGPEGNGYSYDEKTNTLTLSDYKGDVILDARLMGDLTLNIVGDCSIGKIVIRDFYYGGNLKITGTGKLTVWGSAAKTIDLDYDCGIYIDACFTKSCLIIDKDVEVLVYGGKPDKNPDGNGYAIVVNGSNMIRSIYYPKTTTMKNGDTPLYTAPWRTVRTPDDPIFGLEGVDLTKWFIGNTVLSAGGTSVTDSNGNTGSVAEGVHFRPIGKEDDEDY